MAEAHGQRFVLELTEARGLNVAQHRQVAARGLQILAQRDHFLVALSEALSILPIFLPVSTSLRRLWSFFFKIPKSLFNANPRKNANKQPSHFGFKTFSTNSDAEITGISS